MEPVFEREYYLRAADFDRHSRFAPAAMLDLFQDVAGVHANRLGCGTVKYGEDELVWVLVKSKLQVLGDVKMYDKVRVRTWPLKPAAIRYQREYLITSEDGTPVVKGSSEWVLMHPVLRRVVPVKNAYPEGLEHCTDRSFEGRFTRVADFEAEGDGWAVQPRLSDVDLNGHVNNTKYANFVLDALQLDRDEAVDAMQIDYHREVLSGAALTVYTRREGQSILAKGVGDDGEVMFICSIQLK